MFPVNESLNGWIKEELFIDFHLEYSDDLTVWFMSLPTTFKRCSWQERFHIRTHSAHEISLPFQSLFVKRWRVLL